MLETIGSLPAHIYGVRATEKITKEDYEKTLEPLLERVRSQGERIGFLYQFAPEFKGFSPGAAWRDFRVGLRYLRLFKRCAIVTDKEWLERATMAIGTMMPCPVKAFGNDQFEEAMDWLKRPSESKLDFQLDSKKGILTLRPTQTLETSDFDTLAMALDPWLERGGELKGIVLNVKKFPGWENLGAFARHFQFVKDHHKKVPRLAVCSDSELFRAMTKIAEVFVKAEVRRFEYEEFEAAEDWILQGEK